MNEGMVPIEYFKKPIQDLVFPFRLIKKDACNLEIVENLHENVMNFF